MQGLSWFCTVASRTQADEWWLWASGFGDDLFPDNEDRPDDPDGHAMQETLELS